MTSRASAIAYLTVSLAGAVYIAVRVATGKGVACSTVGLVVLTAVAALSNFVRDRAQRPPVEKE